MTDAPQSSEASGDGDAERARATVRVRATATAMATWRLPRMLAALPVMLTTSQRISTRLQGALSMTHVVY